MTSTFSRDLIRWYEKNKRDLPWRRTSDPYKIWISEVMLQQTTVSAVIPYFTKWISTFPTVESLASTPIQKVLTQWQGLGYYQRAKNLHKAAQTIVAEHRGRIPETPEALRKLPGFGPYTVGAVLSIAFDRKITIIDANVRRVIMRILAIEGTADTSQDKRIQAYLESILPNSKMGSFNQGLMELGALVCRSKEPLCILCPVRSYCQAYKQGKQEIIPTPKKRVIKDIAAAIAIIEHKGKFLIQKRPSTGLLADLWEFPGGKIEAGETPREALEREVKEELGVSVLDAKYLFDVTQFYTQFRVSLSVWQTHLKSKVPETATRKWVSFDKIAHFAMPSGSAKIFDKIAKSRLKSA